MDFRAQERSSPQTPGKRAKGGREGRMLCLVSSKASAWPPKETCTGRQTAWESCCAIQAMKHQALHSKPSHCELSAERAWLMSTEQDVNDLPYAYERIIIS